MTAARRPWDCPARPGRERGQCIVQCDGGWIEPSHAGLQAVRLLLASRLVFHVPRPFSPQSSEWVLTGFFSCTNFRAPCLPPAPKLAHSPAKHSRAPSVTESFLGRRFLQVRPPLCQSLFPIQTLELLRRTSRYSTFLPQTLSRL